MKEIPMMMKSFLMPMVLDGSKTQSRRLGERWKRVQVGDRVWMREAWQEGDTTMSESVCNPPRWVWFKGDMSLRCEDGERWDDEHTPRPKTWRPAVHMPRSVCRFVGEVVGVRQEHLQDITEGDAEAEGMGSLSLMDMGDIFGIRAVNRAMDRTAIVGLLGSRVYRFAVLMELMTPGIWAKNPQLTVVEWRKI